MSAVAKAIEEYRPQIEKNIRNYYERWIKSTYNSLVAQFGLNFRGIYNSQSIHVFKEYIVPCCTTEHVDPQRPYQINGQNYILNQEKLNKKINDLVEQIINSWKSKIENKLGNIEKAKCSYLNGTSFLIVGENNGKRIEIEQKMIINISKNGLLFNQFPARIHVDGKSFSEKKFKELIS